MDVHEKKILRKRPGWCKIVISTLIPCILGIFTIIFTLQQQNLSKQQQAQQHWHQLDSQRQQSFTTYIDDISEHLTQPSGIDPVTNKTSLLYIRTKTLTVLRTLDVERKKYVVLFLYESGLIRDSRLDLSGADLNNVQLIGPYILNNLTLAGVFWSNATFVDCHLKNAIFDRSVMNNAHFIRSTLESASLAEAVLNNTDFTETTVIYVNFTGALLIEANFLKAEVVQGIKFTNSDLFGAHFTKEQFNGQRTTIVPNTFDHGRLPNGTFGKIDARKNLIQNGDAEKNCSTKNPGSWLIVSFNRTLYTLDVRNISVMNMTFGGFDRGNCSFSVQAKTRVSQIIDLRLYSVLIDAGQAVFSASALIGCDVPGNVAYLSVSMQRSDALIQGQRLFLSSDNTKLDSAFVMQPYEIRVQRVIKGTRRVIINFGVETLPLPDLHIRIDMATTITEEEQDELFKDVLTCVICSDYYSDPRLLPCSHTFCFKCIKQATESNNGAFPCPFRDGTTIQKTDITTLPNNRAVRDIVEKVLESKAIIQCNECEKQAAKVWCRDCHNNGFCQECYQVLHQKRTLKDHQPSDSKPPKIYHCSDHPGRELEYWCPANDKIYCSNCLADKKDTHKCELITDGIKKIANRVTQAYNMHPFSIDPKIEIEKMFTEYKKVTNSKRANVAEVFASVRKMIDDCEKSTNEKLSTVDDKNKKQIIEYEMIILSKWRRYREQWVLFKQTMDTGDYVKVLQEYKNHEENLTQMKKEWSMLKSPTIIEYKIEGLDELRTSLKQVMAQVIVIEQPPYDNTKLESCIAQQENNSDLNLNNRKLNDADIMIVAQALRISQTITTVHLGNNLITAAGAKHIANALRYNTNLTTLDLWNNQIGADGAQHFAEILRSNRTLTSLGLNTNDIKDQGAQALADALRNNKALTELYMADNRIGDPGAQALRDALRNNTTIVKLQLFQSNQISATLRKKLETEEQRLH
ncbi:unnamed protein product [Rotaria socialis]|uniref:RING-type domain-containing protein n=1 Tax=Rotaria socialis TaxID=392032 RepID=A0A821BIZ2_9BILA|nr:unnamed protein product [Rotaria socialis]